MAQEVAADQLGDEFKGYVVRITGGNDVRSGQCCGRQLRAPADGILPSHPLCKTRPSRLDSTRLHSPPTLTPR